jgi:hypothetical protein
MPKLLIFAACEKAIIDQQTKVVSLLSLLENVNVQFKPGAPPPPSNAAIPMMWAVVSIFKALPGDVGKTFEQRTTMEDGSATVLFQGPVAEFRLNQEGASHRIISQVNGMHIGTAGARLLKCYLREKGAADWCEVANYPMSVVWQMTPAIVQ